MNTVFVVVGELEDSDEICAIEGVYATMDSADEALDKLNNEQNGLVWHWQEMAVN